MLECHFPVFHSGILPVAPLIASQGFHGKCQHSGEIIRQASFMAMAFGVTSQTEEEGHGPTIELLRRFFATQPFILQQHLARNSHVEKASQARLSIKALQ
jgi:hypothetical protein